MKKIGVLIVAASVSSLLAGPVLAEGKTIGVSWSNFQEERWKTDEAAIKAVIEENGDTYISADAQSSAAKQLSDVEALPVEEMSIESLVSTMSTLFAGLYQDQRAVLPLAQAMSAVPEIRDLDEKHDELVIMCLSRVFKRLGIGKRKQERKRIGSIYLDTIHSIMLVNVNERGVGAKRTLADVNAMIAALLYRHLN